MAYEDQEQIDAIKKWWKENQRSVLGGMFAVAVGFGGYTLWQSNKASTNAAAAEQYQAYAEAQTDEAKAVELTTLQDEFSGQSYSALASLSAANQAAAAGDYETAEAELRWVSENNDTELKGLADIRLAKVLWEMDKVNQALEILDNVDASYQVQALELKGDIYSSQNQWAEATMAYEQALSSEGLILDKAALQLKLDYVKSAS